MELITQKWFILWNLNEKIYESQVVDLNTFNRFQKKSAIIYVFFCVKLA